MTQAIEDAAQKATKDEEEIKELYETNEVLLHKYHENERHLQRFLTRATPRLALPSSTEAALQDQINKLQEELKQERLMQQSLE